MNILKKLNKSSISFRLMYYVILLVFVQAFILIATIYVGGVVSQVENNSLQTFEEKVTHQRDYLLKEMNNRRMLIPPYIEEISTKLSDRSITSNEELLNEVAPQLISMLRATVTNGVFLILNETGQSINDHYALYLRDYDAYLNDNQNSDLYCIVGLAETCISMKIPFDTKWSYYLRFTASNRLFYDRPASSSNSSLNSEMLGYWSNPFQLTKDDETIITYSFPIFDKEKNFRGVLGVELLENEFIQMLPGTDLLARDNVSYFIGYQSNNNQPIYPAITNGALQKRILHLGEPLELSPHEKNDSIMQLMNHELDEKLFVNIQPIQFYLPNTPFENEEWYLIGLVTEDTLFGFSDRITKIIVISLVISIIVGIITSLIFSKSFTNPIVKLAKQVKLLKNKPETKLLRTGIMEIDNLSETIETTNKELVESTAKLSKILNLVNIPLAAFEIHHNKDQIFVTENLRSILLLCEDEEKILLDKKQFIHYLNTIMCRPEPEEISVYKLPSKENRWVRISIVEDDNTILGTVVDVTNEILDKLKIKQERDNDALTNIYNRASYKRIVSNILEEQISSVSAIIMFDLDNLKQINDTFGHKWGDFYISKTAEALKIFKEFDGIVGRISGDEFSVFLYSFESREHIRDVITTFYQYLEKNPLKFPNETRNIKISGGLFWIENGDHSLPYEDLLQKADEALYVAKRSTKGVCIESDTKLPIPTIHLKS